jgi:hypothetical protein
MNNSLVIAVLLLLLFGVNSLADEAIEGEYSTVTESQCNFILTLEQNGKGSFAKSCRREDGSHIDDIEKKQVSWKLQNNTIIVSGLGAPESFTIHSSLSCDSFGKTGSRFGLVGYGGYEFWKVPITCK